MLTVREGALELLFEAGEPMYASVITERLRSQGNTGLQTRGGITPEQTVRAELSQHKNWFAPLPLPDLYQPSPLKRGQRAEVERRLIEHSEHRWAKWNDLSVAQVEEEIAGCRARAEKLKNAAVHQWWPEFEPLYLANLSLASRFELARLRKGGAS